MFHEAKEETPQRVSAVCIGLNVEQLGERIEIQARIEQVGIGADHLDIVAFFQIILVLNITYNLFDDVLNRHQPSRAAIFIDHGGNMDAMFLHLL